MSLRWSDKERLLYHCSEDFLCLADCLFLLRREGVENKTEQRWRALRLIREMLADRLVEAGEVSKGDKFWEFKPWGLSPVETIAEIQARWNSLGRDPGPSELVWFALTMKGQQEAERLRRLVQQDATDSWKEPS